MRSTAWFKSHRALALPVAVFAAAVTAASVVTLWSWSYSTAVHHAGFVRFTDLAGVVQHAAWKAGPGGLFHYYAGPNDISPDLPAFQLLLMVPVRLGSWLGLSPAA